MNDHAPEDGVEQAVEHLLRTFGPGDRLEMLRSAAEGLRGMRVNPAQYLHDPDQLEPMIEAADRLVRLEEDRQAGRIH